MSLITSSAFVIGLVLIGHIDVELVERVTRVVTQYDQTLDDISGVTCWVWLKKINILQELLHDNLLTLNGDIPQFEKEIP